MSHAQGDLLDSRSLEAFIIFHVKAEDESHHVENKGKSTYRKCQALHEWANVACGGHADRFGKLLKLSDANFPICI